MGTQTFLYACPFFVFVGRLRGHLAACFGAFPARFRAAFALLSATLLAFGGAAFADVRAGFTELTGAARFAATARRAVPADARAVDADIRAAGIAAHAILGTSIAFLRARDAGIDARLHILFWHLFHPFFDGCHVHASSWTYVEGQAISSTRVPFAPEFMRTLKAIPEGADVMTAAEEKGDGTDDPDASAPPAGLAPCA